MNYFPVLDWDTGVLPPAERILVSFQYQTERIQDADEAPWSVSYLLTADQTESLIEELQHRLKGLR